MIVVNSEKSTPDIELWLEWQATISCGPGELSEEGTRGCLFKINCLEAGALTEQAVASLGSISTRPNSANKQLCTNRINQGTLQAAGE